MIRKLLVATAAVAVVAVLLWRQASRSPTEALEARLLARNPAAQAAHRQGEAAFASGALDDAALGFETAARLEPHSALAFFNLGNVDARRGRHAEAIAAFHRATELRPQWAAAWQQLANAYVDDKQLPKASDAANRATNLSSRSPGAWLVRSQVELQRGELAAAERSARRALSLDDRKPEAWLALGDVLFKRSGTDHTEMLRAFQQADELSPTAYTERRLGEAELQAGSPNDAVKPLLAAASHDPHDAAIAFQLAQALRASGNTTEADRWALRAKGLQESRYRLASLQQKVKQAPLDPRVQEQLGQELERQGQFRQAMDAFHQVLSLDPDAREARRALARLEAHEAPVGER